jgi:hypothetical protein
VLTDFLAGAITLGYLVVAAFFLRFWRRTSDPLFAIFALAFLVLAGNQAVVTLSGIEREALSWVYLLRAAAFTLIIVAIVAKNLPNRRT